MQFKKLDNDNYALYAAKHYDNPTCRGVEEFNEDLTRIIYLKRLFRRYRRTGELRERLILNHIIVLYNIFGEAATQMLFYKIEEKYWSTLVTFLVYLDRMPDELPNFNLTLSGIELDENVIKVLRNI